MRLGVLAVTFVLLLSGGLISLPDQESNAVSGPDDYETKQLGGGTVSIAPGVVPGERFLQSVAMPDHILNPYKDAAEDEKPGDNYDDPMLVLQRRHTDHSFWTKPLTGGLVLSGVHGTAANPICICDTEFVFMNETGTEANQYIVVEDSSHILFDNVTVFGRGGVFTSSSDITVTRSRILSAVITPIYSDRLVFQDNDFIGYEGVLGIIQEDPFYSDDTGLDDCWPNPDCQMAGVSPRLSDDILVSQNYFDYGGYGTILPSNFATTVHHNSFFNSVGAMLGVVDENQLTWNLFRGAGFQSGAIGGIGYVANNSWVLTGEAYPRGEKWSQAAAITIFWGCDCVAEFNDFIGYGTHLHDSGLGGSPALYNQNGYIEASNNYWSTQHDPQLPEGVWIRTQIDGTTTLDSWFTEPIHDLGPFVQPINPQDAERWSEEAPKRILELVSD